LYSYGGVDEETRDKRQEKTRDRRRREETGDGRRQEETGDRRSTLGRVCAVIREDAEQ